MLRLDRTVGFAGEIVRLVEGGGSESRAVDLLIDAEQKDGLEVTPIRPFPAPLLLPDELYPHHIEGKFYDFLSATNLILSGADASRLLVTFSEGYAYAWGLREWGHVIAKWANRTIWLGRRDWNFGEFTGGPSDATIENYNLWSATAMRILKLKCRGQIESARRLIPELLDHLLLNPNKQLRQDAAATLGSIGTKEARLGLQKAMETEKDEVLQGTIRYYLSLSDF